MKSEYILFAITILQALENCCQYFYQYFSIHALLTLVKFLYSLHVYVFNVSTLVHVHVICFTLG